MRLTLRTLLAYLDDTLDPSETKLIGQKVAESDAAQELIARIKQVTRRRRLTTPPATGPNSFEPNTVAEYLDNTLSPEQVADVEKACLESDVHLAEIAAAHQILTLVLGQPALVPPTAKQRMYALVHGRKAARPRAAATPNGAASPEADARAEEDETLLMGLPFYRRQTAMRWLLPLAGVLLLAALGLAVWHRLPSFGNNNGPQVASLDNNNPAPPLPSDSKKDDSSKEDGGTKPITRPVTDPGTGPDNHGTTDNNNTNTSSNNNSNPPAHLVPVERPAPPSEVRVAAARVGAGVIPGVLLSKAAGSDAWKPRPPRSEAFSRELLVSLPGFVSDLELNNSEVKLSLRGSLYEFHSPYLESAVMLYVPPKGFDGDFKLDRGAVRITNKQAKGKVRVRIADENWDVELLEPDTEVGVALRGQHTEPYGSGEPPLLTAFLVVRQGRALVRFTTFAEPVRLEPYRSERGTAPVLVLWDSKTGSVSAPMPPVNRGIAQQISVFDSPGQGDLPDQTKQEIETAKTALKGLEKRLSGTDPIEATLAGIIAKEPGSPSREAGLRARLAVRCLGALDSAGDLVSLLDNSEVTEDLRQEAIVTLRHWIGRNAGQELALYDPKNRAGVLSKGFSSVESPQEPPAAAIFMELLHTPNMTQLNSAPFWAYLIGNLNHRKLAIRELAYFHLRILLPQTAERIHYNPAAQEEVRKKPYDEWKKLVDEGKLPPRQPAGG